LAREYGKSISQLFRATPDFLSGRKELLAFTMSLAARMRSRVAEEKPAMLIQCAPAQVIVGS
jgi:hypothetical protein